MGKKISIIIEETGTHGGRGFHLYIEGIPEAVNNMTPKEQLEKLSPAEFWGLRCFQLCAGMMKETGVLKEIIKPGSA